MNKLLIITVVVFIIIACILFSAVTISSENKKYNKNGQYETVTVSVPAAKEVNGQDADYHGNRDILPDLLSRIENLEQMQRSLYDRIERTNSSARNSSSSASSQKQRLSCSISGYVHADGTAVDESEINENLNRELASGEKKIVLICGLN